MKCILGNVHIYFAYFLQCHKGQVNQIEINPELSQFISLGAEPSLRLWKVELSKEEQFVPLLDISWKYPIRHVAHVREVLAFALSHHDSGSHKVVMFNTSETGNNKLGKQEPISANLNKKQNQLHSQSLH